MFIEMYLTNNADLFWFLHHKILSTFYLIIFNYWWEENAWQA